MRKLWQSGRGLSPNCMQMFEVNRTLSNDCLIRFNGDEGYEVDERDDRHRVMIREKQCTCRRWELTDIPCEHAIPALRHARVDPISQISRYYHKNTNNINKLMASTPHDP